MKSFVVLTYYQLMHAVACALTLKEKANLYFSQNYLDISEDFLERIRETGLFYKVVGLSQKEYVVPFTEELKKTKGMSEEEIDAIGNSIFEKYLEPHYAELFKDCLLYTSKSGPIAICSSSWMLYLTAMYCSC